MAWQLVLIVLLPKPDGGKRPIGLFPSAGMSATKAAWLSAWEAEDAAGNGSAYCQALLDLVKAFETVPHDRLWHAASKRGYPMAILRLALKAYAMPRTVGIDGVYSRTVTASRGITAGSGTATAELSALVLDLLDILEETHPEVLAAVYVDDINLEVKVPIPPPEKTAKRAEAPAARRQRLKRRAQIIQEATLKAASTMTQALNDTVAFFEDHLGMQVSTTKSVVTASSSALAEGGPLRSTAGDWLLLKKRRGGSWSLKEWVSTPER